MWPRRKVLQLLLWVWLELQLVELLQAGAFGHSQAAPEGPPSVEVVGGRGARRTEVTRLPRGAAVARGRGRALKRAARRNPGGPRGGCRRMRAWAGIKARRTGIELSGAVAASCVPAGGNARQVPLRRLPQIEYGERRLGCGQAPARKSHPLRSIRSGCRPVAREPRKRRVQKSRHVEVVELKRRSRREMAQEESC
jgi:hypothetical protein